MTFNKNNKKRFKNSFKNKWLPLMEMVLLFSSSKCCFLPSFLERSKESNRKEFLKKTLQFHSDWINNSINGWMKWTNENGFSFEALFFFVSCLCLCWCLLLFLLLFIEYRFIPFAFFPILLRLNINISAVIYTLYVVSL